MLLALAMLGCAPEYGVGPYAGASGAGEPIDVYDLPARNDILVVLDMSGSMHADEEPFANDDLWHWTHTLPRLVDAAGMWPGWRLAVLPIGDESLAAGRWLDSESPPGDAAAIADEIPERLLRYMGDGWNNDERGLDSALWALDALPGFWREGAAAHVIFISDGDDTSDIGLAAWWDAASATPHRLLITSGVVNVAGGYDCSFTPDGEPVLDAPRYDAVVNWREIDICDVARWPDVLLPGDLAGR